jgi:hypothetical protein
MFNPNEFLVDSISAFESALNKDIYDKALYELCAYRNCWNVLMELPDSVKRKISVDVEKYLDLRIHELKDQCMTLRKCLHINDDIDVMNI